MRTRPAPNGNVKTKAFILLVGLVTGAVLGLLRVGDWLVVNQAPSKVNAIIVLGGGPIERIHKGVQLYEAGYARWMILSGGVLASRFLDQAQLMQRQAITMGVPGSAILEDNRSTTTYQNALDTKQIMTRHHFKSALVVSSNFHMRRVALVFSLVYRGSGIRLRFVASRDPRFDPKRWWATAEGRFLVISELVLIPVNIIQGLLHV